MLVCVSPTPAFVRIWREGGDAPLKEMWDARLGGVRPLWKAAPPPPPPPKERGVRVRNSAREGV